MAETLEIIARIHTDFKTKFGIPRQSGLAENRAEIVFEPKYRNPDALRGLEGYSHLWLIWDFSLAHRKEWSPTVRPPRLGGNVRMGVFATRSPFRPNPIGLSSVRLEGIRDSENGRVLTVVGADLMDGTPIYDIKPYLPFTDCHPDAVGGFAEERQGDRLLVKIPPALLEKLPPEKRDVLTDLLKGDPRPQYIEDEQRVYGFSFADFEIKFCVKENQLEVIDIISP